MLTLYQIMEVIPSDLSNVTDQFKYNPWEKFWRLEFVYAIPGLLWNVIISQTAAWFALVASEQASVALPKDTTLFCRELAPIFKSRWTVLILKHAYGLS